jgi:rRNA-processing protein FCF1
MKVVLDSNIVIADFWMKSNSFKILFESARQGKIEIFIPEVVVDEIFNKYIQRLQKAKADIESELISYNKLTHEEKKSGITDKDINEATDKYKTHFKKVVSENKIKILAYPNTKHKFLAKKAMLKLKPFNSNEKGYRDCLIWENIKNLLTEEDAVIALPELIFLSNNHKDFANSENELHPDLISELEYEQFDSKSVIVYPNLNEFNDKQARLFFEQASTFENKLRNGELDSLNLNKISSDYLFEHFVGSELYYSDFESSEIPDESSEPTVKAIDENYDVKIVSVRKFNASEFIVDIEFEVESEIDFFIDKHDYWGLGEDKKGISINDSDWNSHVMWASSVIIIPLSMTIIIDNNMEVVSCQINKINENYAQQYV